MAAGLGSWVRFSVFVVVCFSRGVGEGVACFFYFLRGEGAAVQLHPVSNGGVHTSTGASTTSHL